jgi:hypothetical protein
MSTLGLRCVCYNNQKHNYLIQGKKCMTNAASVVTENGMSLVNFYSGGGV